MPTTATKAKEHQERWNEIVRDPALRDLPYKVETNNRGQVVLSPNKNRHSKHQRALQKYLDEYAPAGEVYPEYALATSEGVKVPDVIWTSPEREAEMDETGDPSTLAPEICVEVVSSSNTEEEIQEKRVLYFESGADEVWVVDQEEQIHFFAEEELDRSQIAPDCPTHL